MAAPSPPRERVPPGQIVTPRWPVLHAGSVPTDLSPGTWSLTLHGEVEAPQTLTFAQLLSLPQVDVACDIHCVTSWTKLGMRWRGVPFRAIESLVKPRPSVRFVVMECEQRFTTSLPVDALRGTTSSSPIRWSRPRFRPSTGARCGCSSPSGTSTSPRNGCAGCGSSRTTNPGSGRSAATRTSPTRGGKRGTMWMTLRSFTECAKSPCSGRWKGTRVEPVANGPRQQTYPDAPSSARMRTVYLPARNGSKIERLSRHRSGCGTEVTPGCTCPAFPLFRANSFNVVRGGGRSGSPLALGWFPTLAATSLRGSSGNHRRKPSCQIGELFVQSRLQPV